MGGGGGVNPVDDLTRWGSEDDPRAEWTDVTDTAAAAEQGWQLEMARWLSGYSFGLKSQAQY